MKIRQHKKGIILLLLVVCIGLIGCIDTSLQVKDTTSASDDDADEPTQDELLAQYDGEEEMVVAVNVDGTTDELTFDNVWLNRNKFWGGLIFQGLLMADETINNVQTDLCEEYSISPNGYTYIFELKDNVYWQDGVKLTTEDVVWSIETFLQMQEVNGFVKQGLLCIEGADNLVDGKSKSLSGISVSGQDITITLSEKNDNFLAAIAQLAILPKHCLEDIPLDELGESDFWDMPVGSGPYKMVVNTGKEAVLVVNEYYASATPQIKQIRYKVLENPGKDDFDFTITSDPTVIAQYKSNSSYQVVQTNNLYYRYLFFNIDGRTGENAGLLSNKRIRQALMYGLDRRSIINNLYKSTAINIESGIPSSDSWHLTQGEEVTEYRPALAKKILQEEGFDFDKTLVLTRYSTDDISVKLLNKIAESWAAIGIKTQIVPVEENATSRLFVDADWYDVALKNLAAVDYTEWYYEYSSENQLWSVVRQNRTEFDSLIESINISKWSYERKLLYEEIQEMETDMVYKIPMAIVPQYVIYRKDHIEIPDIEFPNLWYYFDLKISQWKFTDSTETEQ